jgi:hypothetical protein
MLGSKTGLVGHVKQLRVKWIFLHYTIHQEALCGRIIKMYQTMIMVLNIVNLIRWRNEAQRHRAFIALLDEMLADCGDIRLHSDIIWVSARKCLQRSFFCAKKRNSSVSWNWESGTRIAEGATGHVIRTFSRLYCRFNVSFKCPEFEFARQRAEYISPSRSQWRIPQKKLEFFGRCPAKNDTIHFTSCQELKESENNLIDFAEFL